MGLEFIRGKIDPITMFACFYGAVMVFANVAAGVKLENVFGFIVPAGTIAYCLTFPITDIVGEVYGRRAALRIVYA